MTKVKTGRIVKGQAFNLKEQIQFQQDTVVSRTLIDEDSGTVTLFAFSLGQGLSEHTAPFDAIVLGLDGEAEVTIAGKKTLVKEGEMVIIPANHPHALKATENFKMLLIMIKK